MKTKRVLTVVLTAVLLLVSLVGGAAFAEEDTRALKGITVNVVLNEGVKSIGICLGSSYDPDLATIYTSDSTFSAISGKTYSWVATAKDGYYLKESSGTVSFSSSALVNEISPIAYPDVATYYTVTITLNAGVASVNVTVNGTTTAFTSSGTLSVEDSKTVSWAATAKAGYKLTTSSGAFAIRSNTTIAPTATVKSYTVAATVTPSDVDCTLCWKLEWVSGKALTGAVTDYVTMTVASDGKSVTLTFVKNFSAGEMVLTCYSTADPTVKATCTVTCGS